MLDADSRAAISGRTNLSLNCRNVLGHGVEVLQRTNGVLRLLALVAAAAGAGVGAAAGLALPFDDVLWACARHEPPHTSTIITSAVSICRTDITKSGSPIIVTGRWPGLASSHRIVIGKWITGKSLFGKAVSDI